MSKSTIGDCPNCQAKLRLPKPDGIAKKIRCPMCSTVFVSVVATQPDPQQAVQQYVVPGPVRPLPPVATHLPRPGRKPKSSRLRRLVFAVLFAVAVVIVGSAAAVAWALLPSLWNKPAAIAHVAPPPPPPPLVHEEFWIQDFNSAKQRRPRKRRTFCCRRVGLVYLVPTDGGGDSWRTRVP